MNLKNERENIYEKTTKLLTLILVLGMMMGIFAVLGITASAEEGYSGTSVTPPTVNSDNYIQFGLSADDWNQYDGDNALKAVVDELAEELRVAEKSLKAKDAELTESVGGLKTALIIVGVFAGVGVLGNVGLISWMVVSRRKPTEDKKDKK